MKNCKRCSACGATSEYISACTYCDEIETCEKMMECENKENPRYSFEDFYNYGENNMNENQSVFTLSDLYDSVTPKFKANKKDVVVAGISLGLIDDDTAIVSINVGKNENTQTNFEFIRGGISVDNIQRIRDFIKRNKVSVALVDAGPNLAPVNIFKASLYDMEIDCYINTFICTKKTKIELMQNFTNKFKNGHIKLLEEKFKTDLLLGELGNYTIDDLYQTGELLFALALASRQADITRTSKSTKISPIEKIILWAKRLFLHVFRTRST